LSEFDLNGALASCSGPSFGLDGVLLPLPDRGRRPGSSVGRTGIMAGEECRLLPELISTSLRDVQDPPDVSGIYYFVNKVFLETLEGLCFAKS